MWREIRGMGLAYHYKYVYRVLMYGALYCVNEDIQITCILNYGDVVYRLIVVPEQGLLYFVLHLATHVVQAYAQAKQIVVSECVNRRCITLVIT